MKIILVSFALFLGNLALSEELKKPSSPNFSPQWSKVTSQAPNQNEWKSMIALRPQDHGRVWTEAGQNQIVKLSQWYWSWRMAWVRTCTKERFAIHSICHRIMNQAIEDEAAMVRSEVAHRIGIIYRGTSDQNAISMLLAAAKNPKNFRNGKPLFVQRRILYALNEIGGQQAWKEGSRIASLHPASESFWNGLPRKM